MAYKELIDESIFKEQGLICYDIGSKIENFTTPNFKVKISSYS